MTLARLVVSCLVIGQFFATPLLAASSVPQDKNPFLQEEMRQEESIAPATSVEVALTLPVDHEYTEGSPSQYKIELQEGAAWRVIQEAKLKEPAKQLPIRFELKGQVGTKAILAVALDVAYCTHAEPKMCKYKSIRLTQPVAFTQDGKQALAIAVELTAQ